MAEVEVRKLSRAFNIIEGSKVKRQLLYSDLDLHVPSGQFAAIIGASGSGKSTLLHIIGMLDSLDDRRFRRVEDGSETRVPEVESSGQVLIDKVDVTQIRGSARSRFINRNIGFIFQLHHLIPELTALQNVALPMRIAGQSAAKANAQAHELMRQLELGEYVNKQPSVLSGGEKQRVAICRALANKPRVLLADEPTGSLHPTMKEDVMESFVALSRDREITIILVTHDVHSLYDADGRPRVDQLITLRDKQAEISRPERR